MKEVAGILGLSPGTVAFHKYNMMERLGIETNAELLRYGMKNHMAPVRERLPNPVMMTPEVASAFMQLKTA